MPVIMVSTSLSYLRPPSDIFVNPIVYMDNVNSVNDILIRELNR